MIENYLRYGFLISLMGLVDYWPSHAFIFSLISFAFICLLGFGCTHAGIPSTLKNSLFIAILMLLLSFIPALIFSGILSPLPGSLLLIVTLILVMKLISYFLAMDELDVEASERDSFFRFIRFMLLPTLCYQTSYPRSAEVRCAFVVKQLLELVTSLTMMRILVLQYALPAAKNAVKPLERNEMLAIAERVLKLSIPCLCIWLLGFYAAFHSLFNLTAELLHFGDRTFYLDWWNARDLGDYWRLWNIPVYQWLKRHVYKPLRMRGHSPFFAQSIIFLISALSHEYLIAIPTGTFTALASIVMLMQIPLIYLTKYISHRYPSSSFGNYFFWLTFCILGQPICVLLYYWSCVTKS